MTSTTRRPAVFDRPVSHVSYAVADIATAVTWWSSAVGAGPFFVNDPVVFDHVETTGGDRAIWKHSAAFGQWGSLCIELQQHHDIWPARLRTLLTPGSKPVINHVAYISDTPEEDSAELAAAGHDVFIHARVGGVELWLHDARDALGQAVEIHRSSERLTETFARIAAAAQGWDGSDPLRPMEFIP